MAWHKIQNHTQTTSMRLGKETVEIVERAEQRMHTRVISDVIAPVCKRRRIDRREPEAIHPEITEVWQASTNAFQIPHTVTVAVLERTRINLIDHRVPPPSGGIPRCPPPPRCDRRTHSAVLPQACEIEREATTG
jgi:hypothetical protein